jgi:hypothetical protein
VCPLTLFGNLTARAGEIGVSEKLITPRVKQGLQQRIFLTNTEGWTMLTAT